MGKQKMSNDRMIKIIRETWAGIAGATDGQVLEMAKSLPAGTLEQYEENMKESKTDANS